MDTRNHLSGLLARIGDTILGMANSGDGGFGAESAHVPPVSKSRLSKIREEWTENNTVPEPLFALTGKSLLISFGRGFGNLLNIFPPRRRREVYMPTTTPEHRIKEAWRGIGRALCDSTRPYDSPKK
jgi:hypothetical protein